MPSSGTAASRHEEVSERKIAQISGGSQFDASFVSLNARQMELTAFDREAVVGLRDAARALDVKLSFRPCPVGECKLPVADRRIGGDIDWRIKILASCCDVTLRTTGQRSRRKFDESRQQRPQAIEIGRERQFRRFGEPDPLSCRNSLSILACSMRTPESVALTATSTASGFCQTIGLSTGPATSSDIVNCIAARRCAATLDVATLNVSVPDDGYRDRTDLGRALAKRARSAVP